jgi:alcohol dehydrogenase class IV
VAVRYGSDLSFLHFSPTKVVFGNKSLSELPSELDGLSAARALVVTDAVLAAKTDLVERVKKALGRRFAGVYSDVMPDSGVGIVDRGAAKAKELAVDAIVSIGGGSSIDTAKGIAIVHAFGGSLRDHQGFQGMSAPTTPHIAIPTTAGTGSEVTKVAVIKDEEAHQKLLFGDFHLYPRVAILDPELTFGMPPMITAGTGLDAFTHAVEALHAMQAEPVADALALHAIRLVVRHLPAVMKEPASVLHRGQMLIAATMAGIAFDNAQVGLVHAIAHTVGARHRVHHGTANAIALPHVLRFNADVAAEAYREAGLAMGVETTGMPDEAAVDVVARAIEQLVASVGLPTRYRDVGVPEADLPAIAEGALSDGAIVYNPKPVTEASDVLGVLRAAY